MTNERDNFVDKHRLSNKGLTKFTLRGKTKVQCQLKLYCLVHNIEKIKNYGKIAA
ncbi:Mobile element protein [hydrothermal vent metagenome]|uniref:Mobile element protein n=1 Tax=hydrothermal vent metagenome TaxID=652676 RepID=A0A3B0Y1M9_9ZZZZ